MKKLFMLVALFTLTACGTSGKTATLESTGPVYADTAFLSDFSKGLEKRWDFGDLNPDMDFKELITKSVEIEKKTLDKYRNEPFEDSKLQEKVISYINKLDESVELVSTIGSNSFYDNWDKHYQKRAQSILDLTDNYEIVFSDKHQPQLDEMRALGQEVKRNEDNRAALEVLFSNVEFEYQAEEYDDTYKKYVATIENTTGFDISKVNANINLINDEGTVVSNQYIYADNWKNGQKYLFEFLNDKQFEKTDITIEYFEINK